MGIKKFISEWRKHRAEWREGDAFIKDQKKKYKVYKKKERSILELFNQFAGKEVPTARVVNYPSNNPCTWVELPKPFEDPTIQAGNKVAQENNLTLRFVDHKRRYQFRADGDRDSRFVNVHLDGRSDKTVRIEKFTFNNGFLDYTKKDAREQRKTRREWEKNRPS